MIESRRQLPGYGDSRANPAADPPAPWATRLLRLAHELAKSVDSGRAVELVAWELTELTEGALVAVYETRPDGSLELACAAGPVGAARLAAPPSLAGRAAIDRRPVAASLGELGELGLLGITFGDAMATRISSAGRLLGVLLLAIPIQKNVVFHPGLLTTVADLLAASLANAERLELTREEARRDGLTGLENHRAFHEHLEASLRRAFARDEAITLVLFDLDDFKQVNDGDGHQTGDSVLAEVAAAAEASAGGAKVFRIGGDEFAIVAAGPAEDGAAIADALRRELVVRRRRLPVPTICAGIASSPADAQTKDELLHKADVALYAGKRSGKDRVVDYRSDVLGGSGRSSTEVMREELSERMSSESVREGVSSELSGVAAAAAALGRETSTAALLEAASRELTAVLGATACVISRLDGNTLYDTVRHAPAPWDLGEESSYLVDDFPQTRHVLAGGEPVAVALSDPDVDAGEAYVLRKLDMQAVLMLPLRVDGRPWGLVEVYESRPRQFSRRDASLAQLLVGQVEALIGAHAHAEQTQRLYRETIASLSNALEAKDGDTTEHAQEVAALAVAVARRLGRDEDELRMIELAALLHDIGKIRIPEAILNKPAPLTADEWEVVRSHPLAGERILAPIEALVDVVPIVRSTHERWDGGGYPLRLAGDAIPVGARIVAVCDAYRAIVEPRPYRPARSAEAALAELRACAGTQFDPACVEAFAAALEAPPAKEPVRRLERPDHVCAEPVADVGV